MFINTDNKTILKIKSVGKVPRIVYEIEVRDPRGSYFVEHLIFLLLFESVFSESKKRTNNRAKFFVMQSRSET